MFFYAAGTVSALATATVAFANSATPPLHVAAGSNVILTQAATPSQSPPTQMPQDQPGGAGSAMGAGTHSDMKEMARHMHDMGRKMQEMGTHMQQQSQQMQQGGAPPAKMDPAMMGMSMDKMEMDMKDMGGAMGSDHM